MTTTASMNNAAPFPQLRAAYLRAIARAWNDPAYMEKLLRESAGPRGALPFLEAEYDFVFPYDVRLVLSDKERPVWEPIGTTGWRGFGDEFQVWLPAKPSKVEQEADVLGAYLSYFPSLLGAARIPDDVSHLRASKFPAELAAVEARTRQLIAADSVAPPDFGSFGVITSRLIALAWKDEKFAEELYTVRDARDLVQDAMDFLVAWNFLLKFNLHRGDPTAPGYWEGFPRSVITLHIPQRPVIDQQAIALGAYNATGSQYPFSC